MSNQNKNGMPPWVLQATFVVIGAVLATYASLWILGKLQNLVVWLVVALFLSFAIEPLVNILEKRGWKRGLSTGLIIAGLVLLILLFIGAMVPLVIDQVRELIKSAPQWVDRISDLIGRWFNVNLTTQELLDQLQKADLSLGSTASSIANNLLDVSGKIFSGIFQLLTIMLFTYYFVAEGPKLRRKLMTLLPAKQQKMMLETWEIAIEKTGGYLYSRLLLGLISAIVTFIVLSIIQVPFALPLALWMGFISQFIPVVGTYIAAFVPLLVALLENPWSALMLLIYVIIYQQVENYVISPKLTARTMQLHPAVAIAAALAGASLRGAIGALLALPFAAIIQAVIGTYITRHELIHDETGLIGGSKTKSSPKDKIKA